MKPFYYTTEDYHPDNSYTMNDYLENHLPTDAIIIYVDDSYAEILLGGERWEVHAGGNGDNYNHIITFKLCTQTYTEQ